MSATNPDHLLGIYTSSAAKATELIEWLQINVFIHPLSMEVYAQSQDACDDLGQTIAEALHAHAPKLLATSPANEPSAPQP